MYPSQDDIRRLHRKYAPDDIAFDIVYTHSAIVRDIAFELIRINDVEMNVALVETGALLHDIGTYSLYADGKFDRKNYISHGIRGYKILREENYPEEVCRIASNHTGMGITKQMIIEQSLPLPVGDYMAGTIEERLVMYADKFHSKTPKFNTFESYLAFSEQFGPEVGNRFKSLRDEFGLPNLAVFSKKYGHPVV